MRDIARCLGCSRTAVSTALLRLGRQSMSAQAHLLCGLPPCGRLTFDGLVSSVGSQDYAAHLTVLADASTELVLGLTHAVTYRGGKRTARQAARIRTRGHIWSPPSGSLHRAISLVIKDLPHYARPIPGDPLLIDTDEHPLYRRLLRTDLAVSHLIRHRLLSVRHTSGSAPRTTSNPLFAVNYIDRMLRHRMKEHTRETIAAARNASMQMHRAWIFAWDHNACQPHRVRSPASPSRAELNGVSPKVLGRLKRMFFTRRVDTSAVAVPTAMRDVWTVGLPTPPVRWNSPQTSTGPRVPAYALRDLARADLHAQ